MTTPVVPQHKVKRLGVTFQRIYHICCRTICFALVALNSAILDYYLIEYRKSSGSARYLWIVGDILVLCLFLVAFISSYKYYEKRVSSCTIDKHKRISAGDLPLSYISWLTFSVFMSAKVCVIYALPNSIANQLRETNFFGPNTLKTGLSLSAIILYLLVLSHHDFRTKSKQYEFIQCMVGSAYLDLLDTTQFLGVFGEQVDSIVNYDVDKIILAIVCFNYILPTEALYFLARSHFGIYPMSRKFQLVHKVVCFLIVNIPMFAVRMVMWHMHKKSISVFVVKNIIAIGMSFKEVHEFCIEVSDVVRYEKRAGRQLEEDPSRQLEEDPGRQLDTIGRQGSVVTDDSQANCLDPDRESTRLTNEPHVLPSSSESAI